jgi:hypothetical protein
MEPWQNVSHRRNDATGWRETMNTQTAIQTQIDALHTAAALAWGRMQLALLKGNNRSAAAQGKKMAAAHRKLMKLATA